MVYNLFYEIMYIISVHNISRRFNIMSSTRYSKTTYLVLCGLFAALTAICSYITIPLGFTPVPINLGTLAVFLTGGILGRKYGTVSIVVYVLLGSIGIPVFSGFRGGISVLAGPTGGYIIGYIAAVFVVGLLADRLMDRFRTNVQNGRRGSYASETLLLALSMVAGLIVCYAMGTAWFMISTGTPLWASLVSCVFPFLIGDAVKIIAAALLVRKLRPMIN